jgi:hypothetical protein
MATNIEQEPHKNESHQQTSYMEDIKTLWKACLSKWNYAKPPKNGAT